MKIGIISDTHMPARTGSLPPAIRTIFQSVDFILHAGDIEEQYVLDELGAIAPVSAVAGNMDGGVADLPVKRVIQADGHRIGLIHGSGGPRPEIRSKIRQEFNGVDIIVYGHTHQPYWGQEAGIWFMNPGSPTDSLFRPSPSVGLIELRKGSIRGEIVPL